MVKINHADTISPTNKWDCDKANADHVLTEPITKSDISDFPEIPSNFPSISPSPATLRVPQLIEEKTLDSVPSVLFEGLNGNEDEEYLIKYEILLGDTDFIMKPNGLTTDLISEFNRWWSTTGNSESSASLVIAKGGHGCTSQKFGEIKFNVKSGVWRKYLCEGYSICQNGTDSLLTYSGGAWKDSVTNLISLEIGNSGNINFSGKIKLYKMVDLVIS